MKSSSKMAYSVDNLLWTQNKNQNDNEREKTSGKEKLNLKRSAEVSLNFEAASKKMKNFGNENDKAFRSDNQCKEIIF